MLALEISVVPARQGLLPMSVFMSRLTIICHEADPVNKAIARLRHRGLEDRLVMFLADFYATGQIQII